MLTIVAMREWLKYLGARLFQLLAGPRIELDAAKSAAFERLWSVAGSGAVLDYDLPYPKHEFLYFLVQTQPVLLHGSGRPGLTRLEPKRQSTFMGRQVEAVFATPDALWCLFYAVVNGKGFHGSKRNICLRVQGRGMLRKFYWFSLSRPMLTRAEPFCDGFIYILPRQTFAEGEIADEWMSPAAVSPLAVLPVAPADFPFLSAIAGHSDEESPWRIYGRMLWPRRPR